MGQIKLCFLFCFYWTPSLSSYRLIQLCLRIFAMDSGTFYLSMTSTFLFNWNTQSDALMRLSMAIPFPQHLHSIPTKQLYRKMAIMLRIYRWLWAQFVVIKWMDCVISSIVLVLHKNCWHYFFVSAVAAVVWEGKFTFQWMVMKCGHWTVPKIHFKWNIQLFLLLSFSRTLTHSLEKQTREIFNSIKFVYCQNNIQNSS